MSISVGMIVVTVLVQAACAVAVALVFYYLGKQAAEIRAQRDRDDAADRSLAEIMDPDPNFTHSVSCRYGFEGLICTCGASARAEAARA